MCSRCVLKAAGTFFSSIYVRASSVGTCSTSTLQQSLLFPVYTCTYISSAVVRSTYCTAVAMVPARAVCTVVGTVGTQIQH